MYVGQPVVARRIDDVPEGAAAREHRRLPRVAPEPRQAPNALPADRAGRRRCSSRSSSPTRNRAGRAGTAARSGARPSGRPLPAPRSTRAASASSAPFSHGGAAERMSSSSSTGTGRRHRPARARHLRLDRVLDREPGEPQLPVPNGSTSSNAIAAGAEHARPGRRRRAGRAPCPVSKMLSTRPSANARLTWMSWVSHWSATRLDADAGQAERRALVPDPHVHRLAHLGVVRLLGEDELRAVAQAAGQIDAHVASRWSRSSAARARVRSAARLARSPDRS